ncbi:type II secretion system minor pseudopilin GspJ [Psychrobacter sp. PAMC 21119]|uniref:type II secretion system minor pseudopilin GspJ n=1 Tax=Psychrobacter sp. PAMC 21119 TaxID=1112209 RepID=UPI00028A03D1|nr:type II secretion system minor pseudopilin GspJ [Psychrobacter sp. PAMC 21119]
MRQQRGFTLLELMVAMAIFAMLAVAGWQVFDSVNRARERAQFHADNLAVLQYAYLQLQQDMGQIIPYQLPTTQDARTQDISVANSGNESSQDNAIEPEPFMSLDGERVSFVRFADPDPRYQSSTSMQHVEYIFADERLIRRQYTSLATGPDSVSLDSVLLEGVTAARWQAYLPEIATKFPDENSGNNSNVDRASGQALNTASSQAEAELFQKVLPSASLIKICLSLGNGHLRRSHSLVVVCNIHLIVKMITATIMAVMTVTTVITIILMVAILLTLVWAMLIYKVLKMCPWTNQRGRLCQ